MTDPKYLDALHGAGLSAPTFTLSNQVYNYKDQLIEKNIGYRGVNNTLQSIDYQYNTRGWLTGINTVNVYGGQPILTPSGMGSGGISGLAVTPFLGEALAQGMASDQSLQGKALLMPPVADNNVDLFSQVLTYDSPDSRTGAAPQRNGNISSTVWQVAGRDKQAYGFKYDELNRLTEAQYYDIVGTQSTFSTDHKFSEKQTYDLRGNILLLQRNGLNGGSWTSNGYTAATYGRIDSLVYGYGVGNQLTQVRDYSLLDKGFQSVNNPNSTQYTYDKNGNLTSDLNKGILNIEYNVLNLPQGITFTENRQLQFVYDASGAKLRKMLLVNSVVTETRDYVNGVEYKDQVLQRVAHSEGAVIRNDFGEYQHEYVLRDHLGNTRVTFRDGVNRGLELEDPNGGPSVVGVDWGYDDGVITKEDIVQINHYYPFGLNMEGDWNGAQGKNKYQYNGKEWNDDFGLGWNDYGARFYDPAIGRWNAIDPLAILYISTSAYAYVKNTPVNATDPDGRSCVGCKRDDEGMPQNYTPPQQMTGMCFCANGGTPASTTQQTDPVYEGGTLPTVEITAKRPEGQVDASKSRFTGGNAASSSLPEVLYKVTYALLPTTFSLGFDGDVAAIGSGGGSLDLTVVLKGRDAGTAHLVLSKRIGAGGPISADVSGHFAFGFMATLNRQFVQGLSASDIINTSFARENGASSGSYSGYGSLTAGLLLGGSLNGSHSLITSNNKTKSLLTIGASGGFTGGISYAAGSQSSEILKSLDFLPFLRKK